MNIILSELNVVPDPASATAWRAQLCSPCQPESRILHRTTSQPPQNHLSSLVVLCHQTGHTLWGMHQRACCMSRRADDTCWDHIQTLVQDQTKWLHFRNYIFLQISVWMLNVVPAVADENLSWWSFVQLDDSVRCGPAEALAHNEIILIRNLNSCSCHYFKYWRDWWNVDF